MVNPQPEPQTEFRFECRLDISHQPPGSRLARRRPGFCLVSTFLGVVPLPARCAPFVAGDVLSAHPHAMGLASVPCVWDTTDTTALTCSHASASVSVAALPSFSVHRPCSCVQWGPVLNARSEMPSRESQAAHSHKGGPEALTPPSFPVQ